MYRPAIFREDRLDVLHALIRAHPLAVLVTSGGGGLMANLIPFTLIEDGNKGTLRAHLAKANDQLAALREGAQTLVVFQGPQAYISPSWYASKAEHGKVVPTWNYVVVQVRGTPRVIDDHAWLLAQLDDLTSAQERSRSAPWKISDAPASFIAAQLNAIAGIEIPVEQIDGKWKVSQNRTDADRRSVQDGLREQGNDDMARLVADRGPSIVPD